MINQQNQSIRPVSTDRMARPPEILHRLLVASEARIFRHGNGKVKHVSHNRLNEVILQHRNLADMEITVARRPCFGGKPPFSVTMIFTNRSACEVSAVYRPYCTKTFRTWISSLFRASGYFHTTIQAYNTRVSLAQKICTHGMHQFRSCISPSRHRRLRP